MKEITHARSKKNGIFFYSNTIPDLTVEAFVDEKGKIHSQVTPHILTDILSFFGISDSEDFQVRHILTRKQLMILDILLIVFSAFVFRSVAITLAVFYFALLCSKNLLYFIEAAISLKVGSMQSAARFHAAEHMALNAYRKLQRIPTLEEIRHFSRFSQTCGSMELFRNTLSYFLVSICMAYMNVLNPIVYILLIIACPLLVFCLDKVGLLKLLQVFLTSKPTDLELQVAIKGLEEFERMEEKIQKGTIGECICFHFKCN